MCTFLCPYHARYAKLMADLLIPGGKILAECFEYDPKIYGGMFHIFTMKTFTISHPSAGKLIISYAEVSNNSASYTPYVSVYHRRRPFNHLG